MNLSDNKIRVVLILKLQYPSLKKAWVSLLTADGWLLHHDLYHDDGLDRQPDGQVNLYLSDLVGSDGLPPVYCRPQTLRWLAGPRETPRSLYHTSG